MLPGSGAGVAEMPADAACALAALARGSSSMAFSRFWSSCQYAKRGPALQGQAFSGRAFAAEVDVIGRWR